VAEERVVVGRIVRAHGVRGDLLVAPTGDDPDRFARGQKLYLGPHEPDSLTVQSRHDAQGFFRLHFEEVTDRDEAGALVGRALYQHRSELPELPAGSFYYYQLVGLEVMRADGSRLGTLTHVHELPGADLYEVNDAEGGREWMIPARHEIVESIDLEKKEVRLRECDDLLAAVECRRNPGRGKRPRPQGGFHRRRKSGGPGSAGGGASGNQA
jgi:16S rRNA processing protein RimM